MKMIKNLKLNKTTDPVLRRLRWVLVCVIFFDTFNTLMGQPKSYSVDPSTAVEGNEFMEIFVKLGMWPLIICSIIYAALWFYAVSFFSNKFAYAIVFSVILGHYFGASTWMVYHWRFGMQSAIIYGVVLAFAFVFSGLHAKPNSPR